MSDAIDKKKKLLDGLKKDLESKIPSLDEINSLIGNWRDLGPLPAKLKHLEAKFNRVIDQAYGKLDIGKDEAAFLKFKNTVDGYLEQNNARKLNSEQLFIRKKIDEIIKEIKQLENNISFISNASKDNPLVKNVYENIEAQKKDLEIWQRKLDYISNLDY